MEQYHKAEEIIARLAASNPGRPRLAGPSAQNPARTRQRDHVLPQPHRGSAENTFAGPSKSAAPAETRSPTMISTRASWPTRWASSRDRKRRSAISRKPMISTRKRSPCASRSRRAQANDWESRRELSGHYAELAALIRADGRHGRRPALYDRCAAIREEVAAERPDSWPAQQSLGLSYNHQGTMHFPRRMIPKPRESTTTRPSRSLESGPWPTRTTSKTSSHSPRQFITRRRAPSTSGDKDGADNGFHECLRICRGAGHGSSEKGAAHSTDDVGNGPLR